MARGGCQGDLGSVPAGLGGCEGLTSQRGWHTDVATAVTAALVAPGTLLVKVAQVHACACLPGDGAHSHSACKVNTQLGDIWPGPPHLGALQGSQYVSGGPGWQTSLLTSRDVHADVATADAGAALSPGTL